MIKIKKSVRKLPLFLCFMIVTSAHGKESSTILETVSRISALGKVCDYKRLPDSAKNHVLKTALSMIPKRAQTQIDKGLSNYIVFLQDTQNQFEARCSDKNMNQQLCAKLPRRAKTFYKVDVERGVKKIESYISRFRPQIKKALAHCSNADEVVDSALKDIRDKTNITDLFESLDQSNFKSAMETMKGLASDFDIEVRSERVPNPIMKRVSDSTRTVYEDSVVDSGTCLEEAEKTLAPSTLTSNLLKMAKKMADLFNPNAPKSFSAASD